MVDLQDDQPKCCEIQEIFSELWKYTTYVCKKKLTLFLCVSLFFKQCIVVRYDPHTRLAKILLLFVIKMTKLNCTKRFLPWEFYFLDRHDVSSIIFFFNSIFLLRIFLYIFTSEMYFSIHPLVDVFFFKFSSFLKNFKKKYIH